MRPKTPISILNIIWKKYVNTNLTRDRRYTNNHLLIPIFIIDPSIIFFQLRTIALLGRIFWRFRDVIFANPRRYASTGAVLVFRCSVENASKTCVLPQKHTNQCFDTRQCAFVPTGGTHRIRRWAIRVTDCWNIPFYWDFTNYDFHIFFAHFGQRFFQWCLL